MTGKILVLGGYGNFGKRIARALAQKGLEVVIAGRSREKADLLARSLGMNLSGVGLDITTDLPTALESIRPTVVIHTCGPFQGADYQVAESCINAGVHYIDLADGRDFVTGITSLNKRAAAAGVTVVSGASTVPGLSSAVLEHFSPDFSELAELTFGISPGQKAERGLATTKAILGYVGRPLKPAYGASKPAYGWQDLYRQSYLELGRRWMANCDVPDLDLLPQRYGIRKIRFSAGLELSFMHLGLWGLSWLVRAGIPLPLDRLAVPLLSLSNLFNRLGSADGGMHMIMEGQGHDGEKLRKAWFIIAKGGDGPQIPTVPAIVLATRLSTGHKMNSGAFPCVGLVSLEDYMNELTAFNVTTHPE